VDIQQLSVALRQAQGGSSAGPGKMRPSSQAAEHPRAAIEQASGLQLPAGVSVKVVEETEDTLYS